MKTDGSKQKMSGKAEENFWTDSLDCFEIYSLHLFIPNFTYLVSPGFLNLLFLVVNQVKFSLSGEEAALL